MLEEVSTCSMSNYRSFVISECIAFAIFLDMVYIYMHNKNSISKNTKTILHSSAEVRTPDIRSCQ